MYNDFYCAELEQFSKREQLKLLDNKCVLISGATGLIGSYLVDSILCSGLNCTIYCIVRNRKSALLRFEKYKSNKNLKFIQSDFSKPIKFNKKIDYILHLASFSDAVNYAKYPIQTMNTNIMGCKYLLDLAAKNGCKKFFYASSSEIYGTSKLPMTEDNCGEVNPLDIRSCYNEAKRASETMCVSYKSQLGVDVVIGRFCRIYGPTMKLQDSKALSQFMMKSISGQNIILKSAGNQIYSYLYVSDAVSAILTILQKGLNGEAYNIAEDRDVMALKDIAKFVAEQSNMKVEFQTQSELEKKGYSRVESAVLISDKLKALGWKPDVSLKQGIKHTMQVLKQRIN